MHWILNGKFPRPIHNVYSTVQNNKFIKYIKTKKLNNFILATNNIYENYDAQI